MNSNIRLPKEKLSDLCRRHNIRKLSVFGSALRSDFSPKSDIDILVEFELQVFFGFSMIQRELSELVDGRDVDLRTPNEISRYFRDHVLKSAEVQYASN